MWLRWLRWWGHPALLRTVIVNQRVPRDEAIRGVLWRARGPYLVLREAFLLRLNTPHMRIDGEVVIERANVAFVQGLPDGDLS